MAINTPTSTAAGGVLLRDGALKDKPQTLVREQRSHAAAAGAATAHHTILYCFHICSIRWNCPGVNERMQLSSL